MRNVLLTFALLLCFGLSYGQIKVFSDGTTEVGGDGTHNNTAVLTSENGSGVPALEFALNAGPSTGNPDFSFQELDATKAQFKYNINLNAIDISANDASTSNSGLTGADRAMTISGTTKNVAIGLNTAATKLHVNGSVTTSGGVYLTGGSTSAAKSASKFQYGLETIMQMKPSAFTNDATVKRSADAFYSVDAKSLESVAPEFVSVFTHVDYEDDGETKFEKVAEEDYYYINSTMIQLTLVNAMQEQQELIDAQNERIAQLEEAILNLANGTTTQSAEIRDARLGQNVPNPFTEATVINYAVPSKAQTAVMQVFDMNGQLLKTVNVANGNGQLTINAGELGAGTYSYNLVVDGKVVDSKKMVLTK